jgi:hypothetical protein
LEGIELIKIQNEFEIEYKSDEIVIEITMIEYTNK